jgi:hypothetical protein
MARGSKRLSVKRTGVGLSEAPSLRYDIAAAKWSLQQGRFIPSARLANALEFVME